MLIEIRVIPQRAQRYPTVGDWQVMPDGRKLRIAVSRMQDRRSEIAVILHEVAEALLCEDAGISTQAVDDFDLGPVGSDLDEPGDDPRAPYHAQHQVATAIERLACEAMKLDWGIHNDIVDAAGKE